MQVTRLFVHPVKSLGGVSVPCYTVDRFGPRHDRRWLVVDADGKFVTQRQHARMAMVRTLLDADCVTLQAADCEPVTFSAEDFNAARIPVQIWRDQCEAATGPAVLDDWISRYLGIACRLVYMPESTQRLVDPAFATNQESVSFADGFPLLLASETSLEDFNGRLEQPIGMERFRPNLVVEGSAPFAEDHWQRIRVGSMEFRVVKPCSRCAIPTIDPVTGSKQPVIFKTLKSYRQRAGEVFFGQNLLPVGTGTVRVGDNVEVLD